MTDRSQQLDEEALAYHFKAPAGKLQITATKPMATQRDLSLAYSPGVAAPVRAIAADPETAFDFTARGNMVAVITNGTAILGLGNLGALASKPVMEGKAVLFKRFADVNAIDIELDTEDPEEIINAVKLMGPSFGGINLEDIKAPDCFIIEQRLREIMDIPVFHDDQHGTAIICLAGLINALHLTGRKIEDCRIVLNGAGAAGIACVELVKSLGADPSKCIACDTKGVIYQGREAGMNQWKSAHAVKTDARNLADAMKGADIFLGVSAKGALTDEMVRSMAKNPIIFAMANPDPEITPEEAAAIRPDVIMATGRSDYPNQVNNVLGFPFIFRGALDVNARTINEEMKIAAAEALAMLAREDVPDEVAAAYGAHPVYGPDYIIPAPFDPRLIHVIPTAVAKAAMETGVARRPIIDMEAYAHSLTARLDPTANMLQALTTRARNMQKSVVFAEGQDERVVRAALAYTRGGLGQAIVVGRVEEVERMLKEAGQPDALSELTVVNAETSPHLKEYVAALYEKLQRRGFLERDCYRRVARDRHIFAACMLAEGHADAMVTGVSRKSAVVLTDLGRVFDTRQGRKVVGVSAVLARGRTVLVADTMVHEMPNGSELADIAEQSARVARRLGLEPRVALLSYSTFGYPISERSSNLRDAVRILEERGVDFEFDGEMAADVALDPVAMAAYPFCRLSGPANVLVMPARHSASISTKMLQQLEGTTVVGPILTGLERPVQVCSMSATVSEILNMAVIAATGVG
ncbi:NADP-dependent malic enzyme [Pikeienuella piscinae]|uniref:NADP-dependent malic enzyme n=1 Tax=Pikeienuella piscinae TaxID=2748098 RepID=A0A7M3T6J9_9RHOB|nr:NADP-dependent malic enzyme [Pikeienuella piscinae]QIE57630.1 NADP-dependent malic enzyme [Pikeienuella piscinae]